MRYINLYTGLVNNVNYSENIWIMKQELSLSDSNLVQPLKIAQNTKSFCNFFALHFILHYILYHNTIQ